MPALPSLVYAPADGSPVIQLNEGDVRIVNEVRGFGILDPNHQTVKTPTKRGATYVRTVLPERFLEIELGVFGTDFVNLQSEHRTIVVALNPDLGVGVLTYTPDPSGQVYAIDCILEGGAGFTKPIGPAADELVLVLRCLDPTWYDPAISSPSVASSGGLAVPIDIPLDIVDSIATLAINNTGDIETFPVIRVVRTAGSFTSPVITNTTTGKLFSLPSLVVAANDELVIDLDVQTAKVEGVSVMSYRSAASEQLGLVRGVNNLTFAVSAGNATTFTVEYYTRFIGV